ncbi:methyltransferase [Streptomyces sp. NBC_01462]|uniref:methyltransferase n=1 Tax=Streptomyces sp. NBC_01462 TaxID=2903876 RepID=UPI003FCCFDB3
MTTDFRPLGETVPLQDPHGVGGEEPGTGARAMADTADLLVVERVLPADGSASLATAWDLHMMCNVGGRKRRAEHYARLFADAGLTLVDRAPLPLDGHCAARPQGRAGEHRIQVQLVSGLQ